MGPHLASSDGSPQFTSHKVRPFGRGPTTPGIGDENDHHELLTSHGYFIHPNKNHPGPRCPKTPTHRAKRRTEATVCLVVTQRTSVNKPPRSMAMVHLPPQPKNSRPARLNHWFPLNKAGDSTLIKPRGVGRETNTSGVT